MNTLRIPHLCTGILLTLLSAACNKDGLGKKQEKELFAAPTAAETESIYAGWQTRDLTVTEYTELTDESLYNGQYTFKLVGYRACGIQQYGALLIPASAQPMPVRVWVGGFGLGVTENSVKLGLDTGGSAAPAILAIPALRGQSLAVTIGNGTYTSPVSGGEHCDAFDGGTDDVLAFVNLVAQHVPTADVNRTSVHGGSRGGTVALLAGIRDPRVKRVVSTVGPTDMLVLTAAHTTDGTYRCQFLDALESGQLTLQQVRRKIIASSPLYFAQHLPLTQLHMGSKDTRVPLDQGYALEGEMLRLGLAGKFQLFIYDKTHEDIAVNNPGMQQAIEAFLSQL